MREFGAVTRELLEMADWLREGGCEIAAMESTASYWKPLFNILEASGLNAMVVNARHMKAVPGRKTDVKDAEWIAEYVAIAHSMIIAIYHILKDGVVFKDLGADYYNQFNKGRKINAYLKKLKALGWEGPVVAA